MSTTTAPPTRHPLPGRGFLVGRIVHRQALVFRSAWKGMLFAFLEPIFYLFSIGIGVGALIDEFTYAGQVIPYAEFVAPGMLAAAAMNGAIFDATYNFYSYLKFDKVFEQWLTTPMSTLDLAAGQVAWTLVRGGLYSGIFLVVMLAMDMVSSWWALLALPAAALITATFSAIGMAATTFMRSWQDFDFINLAVMPMLLFSGTFFPVTELPGPVRWLVEFTPLYRGVVLCRELTTGAVTPASAISLVYLVALLVAGLFVVRRRLDQMLLT